MAALPTPPSLTVQALISLLNGLITLVLLLIAPLGLAAVITLTLLITASTFLCGLAGRSLQRWLESSRDAGYVAGMGRSDGPSKRRLPAGGWRLPRR